MARHLNGPSMLALVDEMHGPTLWRCLLPFSALEARGYPCGWVKKEHRAVPSLAGRYDGLLLARVSWPRWARPAVRDDLARLRADGRFVVYDSDDDLWRIELTYRALELGWAAGRSWQQLEAAREDRIWALQQADGVTVTTEALAAVARSFTSRPVIVVPNAIDVAWFRAAVGRAARGIPMVTIGWAGGERPDADVEAMAEAWGRIARRFPDVTFVVQGHLPTVVRRAVPEHLLRFIAWLPLERYPEGLVEVDIACCAVADTPFNRCKTPIKAYEAALAGSAVVATPTLYGDVIEHGVAGYLASSADEWEAALQSLVESPALRRMMATRLLRTVEKRHSLDGNLHRWSAAWTEIAAKAKTA